MNSRHLPSDAVHRHSIVRTPHEFVAPFVDRRQQQDNGTHEFQPLPSMFPQQGDGAIGSYRASAEAQTMRDDRQERQRLDARSRRSRS